MYLRHYTTSLGLPVPTSKMKPRGSSSCAARTAWPDVLGEQSVGDAHGPESTPHCCCRNEYRATVAERAPAPSESAERAADYDPHVGGYFTAYSAIGVLLLVGVGFVTVALTANRVLRPATRSIDTPAAATETYECGIAVDQADRTWAQTQIRYYVYAFIYVVFAVETVFVYPWATIFSKPGFGIGALAEMGVFVALLALGLLYAWRKRVLTWD